MTRAEARHEGISPLDGVPESEECSSSGISALTLPTVLFPFDAIYSQA